MSLIYRGLYEEIKSLALKNKWNLTADEKLVARNAHNFSVYEATEAIKTFGCPDVYKPREHQLEAFVHCVRHQRATIVSGTGSGKSLILYYLYKYFKKKTLIIVNTINLLNQMKSDFIEYGAGENEIGLLGGGDVEKTQKPLIIATFQSLVKLGKSDLERFELVMNDECHLSKAASFRKIHEMMTSCPLKFGFTGSLDGDRGNELVIQGLLGPKKIIATSAELIDKGILSDLEIKALLLKYPENECKALSKSSYPEEIDFLCASEKRNQFIINLASSLKGNTLVLFQRVEKHGIPLYDALKARNTHPTYFVAGSTDGDERENIRKIVNNHENSTTVASVGVFSTGTNIPNLHNLIFVAPTKSVIRTIQSIGRALRKTASKTKAVIFDISDDLSWKRHENYTLKHFKARIGIYAQENFKYKIYPINLTEDQDVG